MNSGVVTTPARAGRRPGTAHGRWIAAAVVLSFARQALAQGNNLPARASGGASATAGEQATRIGTHDNDEPAGAMTGKVLRVRLAVVRGAWQPEGTNGPVRDVYAFAEEGRAPTIPGPLLRVAEGVELQVTVRNRTTAAVKIHGLVSRPAATDEFTEVAPGSSREFRFKAGAPGTYYYWARATDSAFNRRDGIDSQLTGAFIVDRSGPEKPTDRIFVMGEWLGPMTPPGTPRKASLVINGRSWPHTERLSLPFGQAVEWRVINGSAAPHPMHLHGTFYTVESRGTATRDVVYGSANRRLVTTELMDPGTTMMMRWVPDRVGNWLFHCHLLAHVAGDLRLGDAAEAHGAAVEHAEHAEHDIEQAMAGLVLGITVQPGDETAAPDLETHVRRRMSLHVRQAPGVYGDRPAYGFSIGDDTGEAPPLGAGAMLSPPIIVTRGEPLVIGVSNEIDASLAIHWHGIELESFNDGVPGWSGQSGNVMPAVQPGQTFDVKFTPPRAGTFIYHTHGHDRRQLISGMYGPLIVTEPGKPFDPAVERIVLLGGAGPGSPAVEINRSTNPPAMQLNVGVRHRFRIINITPNFVVTISLRGDAGPVQWRAVAKDGADLPPNQATARAASFRIGIGETYDFEYEPTAPGELRLEALRGGYLTSVLVQVVR
ncbi:MAG: multicopper oxidase domain-containing protein [Gemmatimonadota bacterium]|nr:multicopper oxidase domain-containing protein [Gemmatimonadota bacterium]